MSRAVSIHIGVDQPLERRKTPPLGFSEIAAREMAEIANHAAYDSMLVLVGATATHRAVHEALVGAAQTLEAGDTLFLSFSGHGTWNPDENADERHGLDEAWCLYDGILLDDELASYWTAFKSGVRIIVLVECCYSGGFGDCIAPRRSPPPLLGQPGHMSGSLFSSRNSEPGPGEAVADAVVSCMGGLPRDSGIGASVLMLTASTEQQPAEDGLFTRCLLDVWAGGGFRGSYCRLYEEVKYRVMTINSGQTPQILMLGAPDPAFPLGPAFHLNRTEVRGRDREGPVTGAYPKPAVGGHTLQPALARVADCVSVTP